MIMFYVMAIATVACMMLVAVGTYIGLRLNAEKI